jgi:hypothetical protein
MCGSVGAMSASAKSTCLPATALVDSEAPLYGTCRAFVSLRTFIQAEHVVVNLMRAPMLVGESVVRHVELPPHDDAVQAMRGVVAREPLQNAAVRGDARPWHTAFVRLSVIQVHAESVIDAAVGIDHGVNRTVVPLSDCGEDLISGLAAAGVDQNQAVSGADRSHVAEHITGVDDHDVSPTGEIEPPATAAVQSSIGTSPARVARR